MTNELGWWGHGLDGEDIAIPGAKIKCDKLINIKLHETSDKKVGSCCIVLTVLVKLQDMYKPERKMDLYTRNIMSQILITILACNIEEKTNKQKKTLVQTTFPF